MLVSATRATSEQTTADVAWLEDDILQWKGSQDSVTAIEVTLCTTTSMSAPGNEAVGVDDIKKWQCGTGVGAQKIDNTSCKLPAEIKKKLTDEFTIVVTIKSKKSNASGNFNNLVVYVVTKERMNCGCSQHHGDGTGANNGTETTTTLGSGSGPITGVPTVTSTVGTDKVSYIVSARPIRLLTLGSPRRRSLTSPLPAQMVLSVP